MSPSPAATGAPLARAGLPALLIACTALAGCRAKAKDFDNENDELRRTVALMTEELERLRAERNELEASLADATRRLEGATGEPAADVIAAIPRCAGIRLGRYSGLVDRDGADGYDAIELYVEPFDGRRRFVQIAGTINADATLIPPAGSSGDPRLLASVRLGPRELREAYRSSPIGTHYTLLIPLEPPNQPLDGSVAVRVVFDDAVTELSHEVSEFIR